MRKRSQVAVVRNVEGALSDTEALGIVRDVEISDILEDFCSRQRYLGSC